MCALRSERRCRHNVKRRVVRVARASIVSKLSRDAHAVFPCPLTTPPPPSPTPTRMYEAVASGNRTLTEHDDGEDDDLADAGRIASIRHVGTDDVRPPRAPGAAARAGSGDGARASTLVHVVDRDRAHRARCSDNNNALANERRSLTNADVDDNYVGARSINEREDDANGNTNGWRRPPPVMEGAKDSHEGADGNEPDVRCNGNDWTRRNGVTQRNGDCRRSDGDRDNCCVGIGERVDVEQIKLEHYKLRTQNVGVQTTHLSPYRLRFWPKAASIKCLDASFMDVVKCCLCTLSQWFLSQVGLTCVLLVWALLGATAFYQTEGPREREQAEQIDHYKVDISIDLATDLRQLKDGSDKWPETIQKYLHKHESLLLHAVSSGYVEGGGSIWTYPGCVLFAVLLLTTLGFGAPVPRTPLGRGMAVLFSAVGIPLHFVLIINASSLIAKCLRQLATIKPVGELTEAKTKRRLWFKWFPPVVAVLYYVLGVIGFGVLRQRSVVECLMFALDFTESGGVANTAGHVRILYALYIEVAVILAATIMSIVQVSATNGIIDLGLRLGLLTNT